MRKVITGEQVAQLYNRDPYALPVWRAPVYQTPAIVTIAVQLYRLTSWVVRLIARHPVAAGVLAVAALAWVGLGWVTFVVLFLGAVVVLATWWWCWPVSFSRWVGRPARGAWRGCRYRRRWAGVKRADRCPQGWDLNLTLVRDDLDDAAVAVLEHQFPGLGVRLAAAAQPGADGQADGVQPRHPVATGSEAVDNWPDGVRRLHPAPGTGCNRRADEVQPAQERGAAVAPEPSREPPNEPSAAPGRARTGRPGGDCGFGGGRAGEFFDGLGDAWPLTAAQRGRILPAVEAALNAGWAPRELAAFTGSNTGGLRNPYAVLTARLSPAELPMPPGQGARSPWCGECDERTRMLGFDGDAPRPCPRCKPVAACRGSRRS